MNNHTLLRFGAFFLLSIVFAWAIRSRHKRDRCDSGAETNGQRYLPFLSPLLLPGFLVGLTIVATPYYGFRESLEQVLALSFGIFLHVSLYYLILLLILPMLRKRISARACAMLWLIPTYLYLGMYKSIVPSQPLWVIFVPEYLFSWLIYLWFAGFLLVLLQATVSHLLFRKRILRNAVAVTDSTILSVWQMETTAANIPDSRYQLVVSPKVTTPLSIGLFRRTTRIVLPSRTYAPEELSLILRHELIHLCREDSANKLFLTFCTAVCWFNPLMWVAMRKSADDLELSCDETVLLDADEETRSLYASLLLKTAGENRGFTTCLSASMGTMRYRLGQILKARSVTSGALATAAIFLLLSLTSGYVALAYGNYTVEEVLFRDGADFESAQLFGINTALIEHNGFLLCRDEEALYTYLSQLSLVKLGGTYADPETPPQLLLFFDTEANSVALRMEGQSLTVIPLGDTERKSEQYQIQESVDWDYLSSLLLTYSIQNEDLPFPPHILLSGDNSYFHFTGQVIGFTKDGQPQTWEPWWEDEDRVGLIDFPDKELHLDFSHTPQDGYQVEITDFQGNLLDSFSSRELADANTLPVKYSNACYIIRAVFEDPVSSIEMQFSFTLEKSNSQ